MTSSTRDTITTVAEAAALLVAETNTCLVALEVLVVQEVLVLSHLMKAESIQNYVTQQD